MKLKDHVAIVTGGSGGLGGASARAMAREGAKVIITDIADAAGKKLAAEIGGEFHHHDVSSEPEWIALVAAVKKAHGRIDILLNAAGIEGDLAGGGLSTSYDGWRKVIAINLDGTFLGCKHVMPVMLERGEGSVINIASIVSFMGTPTTIAYGASKAGVEQMSRSLALIGAADGKHVRCNSVHPGVIKTRMTDSIFAQFASNTGKTDAEVEAMICASVPFGKRGVPDDVASLVLFLASDDSRYVTGSAFRVDGGWSVVHAG
ncbi:MAG: SDR family oxidoreductase [Bradyrhizobiaceae bacterium]|nr:SDR family oxidoreductase [Bradyrhizobiaceae bacterium]